MYIAMQIEDFRDIQQYVFEAQAIKIEAGERNVLFKLEAVHSGNMFFTVGGKNIVSDEVVSATLTPFTIQNCELTFIFDLETYLKNLV